ncbi:MAG: toll/interleukin-1 receptor domain-containing protein [Armatimonadota bacterium]|nr:toll/interleukin-1 receptor domain-containing protein [Armatimonadota bacterium]
MTTVDQGQQLARIFMSFATADRAKAAQVRHFLSDNFGARVFTQDDLSAGEDWVTKLKEEISQCDAFVVLLSPSALASSTVLHELGAAWALGKPIITVETQPGVMSRLPLELRDVQAISWDSLMNSESAQQQICDLLESTQRDKLLTTSPE